ncbi:MAG: hypothetical protein IKO67_04495, partial [Bacteroidaceae bacterium]|nr:hypothetical protein [Bacteroidaceae bacterium]
RQVHRRLHQDWQGDGRAEVSQESSNFTIKTLSLFAISEHLYSLPLQERLETKVQTAGVITTASRLFCRFQA